jgi:hypothetical protein
MIISYYYYILFLFSILCVLCYEFNLHPHKVLLQLILLLVSCILFLVASETIDSVEPKQRQKKSVVSFAFYV